MTVNAYCRSLDWETFSDVRAHALRKKVAVRAAAVVGESRDARGTAKTKTKHSFRGTCPILEKKKRISGT